MLGTLADSKLHGVITSILSFPGISCATADYRWLVAAICGDGQTINVWGAYFKDSVYELYSTLLVSYTGTYSRITCTSRVHTGMFHPNKKQMAAGFLLTGSKF